MELVNWMEECYVAEQLPKLPNDIILDIIKQADGGRTAHKNKFKNCLEEMLEKYTVDVIVWESPSGQNHKLWITLARTIESNMDFEYRDPHTGEIVAEMGSFIYSVDNLDSDRFHDWGGGSYLDEHSNTFDYKYTEDSPVVNIVWS